MYLTYAEYQAYGGTLPESDFTLAEFKARKRVDYLTDSRVENMTEVPEAVKLAMIPWRGRTGSKEPKRTT